MIDTDDAFLNGDNCFVESCDVCDYRRRCEQAHYRLNRECEEDFERLRERERLEREEIGE